MNQPKNKKIGSSVAGKSGTGLMGKSSDSKTRNPSDLGGNKSSKGFASSSSKSYSVTSYNTPKKGKSAFGIIWIPSKKRNKKKDMVFNSNQEGHSHQSKERSPSIYNLSLSYHNLMDNGYTTRTYVALVNEDDRNDVNGDENDEDGSDIYPDEHNTDSEQQCEDQINLPLLEGHYMVNIY